MSQCPKCAAPVPEGARECGSCGVILERARRAALPVVVVTASSPDRSRLWLPGLVVLVGLIGLGVLRWLGSGLGDDRQPPGAVMAPGETAPAEVAPPETLPVMAEAGEERGPDPRLGRLVESRAGALLQGNLEGYLATYSPRVRPAAAALFDRIRRLPFHRLEVEIESSTPEEVRVVERVGIEGLEGEPFVMVLENGLEDGPGGPRFADLGRTDELVPWIVEPMETSWTNHFVVLSHPERRAARDGVYTLVESAWLALYQRYLPMHDRYLAVVPGNPAFFGQLSPQLMVAGVATWRYFQGPGGEIQVVNPILFLNPVLFLEPGFDRDTRYRTLLHEMTHLALAPVTREWTPLWLVEGSAVHFSGGYTGEGDTAALGRSLGVYSLARAGRPRTLEEYAYAGAAVEYLVTERGVEHYLEFYRSFALGQASLDQRLVDAYGFGVATLERGLEDWLAANLRVMAP